MFYESNDAYMCVYIHIYLYILKLVYLVYRNYVCEHNSHWGVLERTVSLLFFRLVRIIILLNSKMSSFASVFLFLAD